ncbi:MAG: SDR family NAD(P)-dependent oxidoreductase [Chloroflexi bacterium]|nr:SDR family NAD(P)-dependent oxidoreductase [Chloroflexota bacterium]
MQELRNKVAVITGGASGIGRALADRALEEGMRIVLADVELGALDRAAGELKNAGADLLAVRCDVSQAEAVDDLSKRTLDRFGAVHLLFNNAGVGSGGPIWEQSLDDWKWVLGVNLMGVVHGIHAFVPIMLAQNEPSHIVNTASMAGLVTSPGMGAYNVSKHGVVTLSETLSLELAERNAPIKVSVLCPGWINTRIAEADRNRPGGPSGDDRSRMNAAIRQAIAHGLPAAQVADLVFAAVRSGKFYILTHPNWKPLIRQRMQAILDESDPANGMGRTGR